MDFMPDTYGYFVVGYLSLWGFLSAILAFIIRKVSRLERRTHELSDSDRSK